MEPFVQKDKSYFVIPEWKDKYPNVIAGFTTKHGGFSSGTFDSLNMGFHVDDSRDICMSKPTDHIRKDKFPC